MVKKAKRSKRGAKKAAVKKAASSIARKPRGSAEPLRFAHPFFTMTPVAERAVSPVTNTTSLSQFAAKMLGIIPPPAGNSVMDLKDLIGQAGVGKIQQAGAIKFHAVGDSGRSGGDPAPQEQVAEAMTADYDPAAGGRNPALLIHLGDVIYGHSKAQLYRDEFYRPYMKYPGKIIAIPGNHDGETFKDTDPVPLKEFRANFCAPTAVIPPIASGVGIVRETMVQPGVYWMLKAPFVNVIGLYSNVAEGPGNLLGANGDDTQVKWLAATLTALKQSGDRKALVIATHHPPYSSGGHHPSTVMLAQIDKVCADTGIVPHAMLAGHAHNYQRYTRTTTLAAGPVKITYLVAGCGGHAATSVTAATGQRMGETIFEKSMKGFGYLTITANATELVIEMTETTNGVKKPFDKVTIGIADRSVT